MKEWEPFPITAGSFQHGGHMHTSLPWGDTTIRRQSPRLVWACRNTYSMCACVFCRRIAFSLTHVTLLTVLLAFTCMLGNIFHLCSFFNSKLFIPCKCEAHMLAAKSLSGRRCTEKQRHLLRLWWRGEVPPPAYFNLRFQLRLVLVFKWGQIKVCAFQANLTNQ